MLLQVQRDSHLYPQAIQNEIGFTLDAPERLERNHTTCGLRHYHL